MIIISYLLYFIIGVIAGLMGAVLGIGGGAITVPALLLVFSFIGFPKDNLMHLAIGTSLSSMVINTLAATYFHNKKKSVVWIAISRLFLGIIIGSVMGTFIARELSTDYLKTIFGGFACLIGFSFFKAQKSIVENHKMPNWLVFTLIGIAVASLANLLGLGGGFFMLPILFYFHFEGKKAIGTSSATSFIISLCGSIGYLLSAKEQLDIPGCYGYIYVPAFLIIGLTSLATSFYGVKLAHILPINIIRKIFAVTIITIGVVMIFQ